MLLFSGNYSTPAIGIYLNTTEPLRWIWLKAKGNQYGIGGQDLFTAGNHFRSAATIGVWLTHLGGDHFNAFNRSVADNLYRLHIEFKLNTLFAGIFHLASGSRHILFVATVGTGYAGGTLADGGSVAVHGCITTAENHNALALDADKVFRGFFKTQVAIDVGNQE